MSEKYPTWLTGHVKEWAQKRLPTVTLCSTTGNELLEVWYYGDLLTLNAEPQLYIVPSYFAPELVTARDPESGEEFVIFDGGRHGYDNLFCDEQDPDALERRPLRRYDIPASRLVHWYIASVLIGAVILIGAIRNWNWLCDPTGTRDAHRHSRGYRRVVSFSVGCPPDCGEHLGICAEIEVGGSKP